MTIITPNALEEALNYYQIVQPNEIIDQVAQYYNMDRQDLVSSKFRNKEKIANARQVCQYIIRKKTNLPLTKIGELFNRRYTTIIHAIQKVEEQMTSRIDNRMRNDVNKLNDIIKIN
jgi:chromosomal replication initiation ATPase DnaA